MNRSDIRVLVVEDDISIGKALYEALKRRGFECKLVRTPDEAVQAIKFQEFKAVVIDCMLPKMNGIELAVKLRELNTHNLVTILMSGIFKDRNFSKDAIYKANASGFLIKPFPMDNLFEILEDAFGDRLNGGKEGWMALYTREEITLDEVQTAIDRYPNVHGFHLPWIYSLLMSTQYSGHLNILSASGEMSSVTFSHGIITQMHLKDKSSYFGVLLVEMGYAEIDDVNQQLAAHESKPNIRLGDKLISAGAISPHAVRLILQEQMKIRLSKTIRNENMEIHLVPEITSALEQNALGWKEFLAIAADWMSSKLTFGWLKMFYGEWANFSIENIATPLIGPAMREGPVMEQYQNANQHEFLKNLHYQLLQRTCILSFSGEERPNFEAHALRLRTIIADMDGKNHFEILGLTAKAPLREITRAYQDLAKTFHPDKLPPKAPPHIVDLTNEIFSRISLAHDTLKQTSGREKYLKRLEYGRTEEVFLADSLLEQSRALIKELRYADALKALDQVLTIKNAPSDARLLWLWASLKMEADPEEMQNHLMSIEPENRHTPLYFMVKGLFYKSIHNFERAERQFHHAISLDPHMKEAKRELLNVQSLNKKSAVGAEVSQIVDLIFGKKKRR